MTRNFPEFNYEVIAPNEDPYLATIKKTGQTAEFNLRAVIVHRNQCAKVAREKAKNLEIKRALIANTEEHNPFVTKLSEQELFTAASYHSYLSDAKTLEDELKEAQEVVDGYDKELADISEATGLKVDVSLDPVTEEVNTLSQNPVEDHEDA